MFPLPDMATNVTEHIIGAKLAPRTQRRTGLPGHSPGSGQINMKSLTPYLYGNSIKFERNLKYIIKLARSINNALIQANNLQYKKKKKIINL